ncbi:MAG TPA: superoxide dismutase [Bacteroidales bacterium]|nr:superoxide dismutase [Bacteroidales bacterium]HPT02712.1 superoxide dismutase [Bacteroidales bacterium]
MIYQFPELPYAYDALEPYIDRMTMEIHHTKHHKAYFDKFLAAVKDTGFDGKPLEEIIRNAGKAPAAVRNNGGGFYNHSLFWEVLSPTGGGNPAGKLADSLRKHFGTFDEFKARFSDAAINRFGSGWAWLSVKSDGSLCVCSSPNQDNPMMDISECNGIPILALDVWEHAYYLRYQNRRPEYVSAFWNIVNWQKVNENYEKVLLTL